MNEQTRRDAREVELRLMSDEQVSNELSLLHLVIEEHDRRHLPWVDMQLVHAAVEEYGWIK